MSIRSRMLIFMCCFCFTAFNVTAQDAVALPAVSDSSEPLISAIRITGNKRTKDFIILREIQFKPGDRLRRDVLAKNFLQARNQVYNTNLFIEVKIDSVKLADSSLQVNVAVREKLYAYPTPQFQLADRSFNEWIKTYHASFNRVVYGVKFAHYNFTGRRDQLRLYLLNGYARNIAISYSKPYANRALTAGYGVSAGFTQNREVGFRTNYNNKILNYKREGFVRNSFNAGVAYNRRKGFFKSSSVALGLSYINADDSLTSFYNRTYFNDTKHYQFFPDLSVGFSYVNTDNNNYPLRGLIYGASLSKRGVQFTGGINNTTLQGTVAKFITHRHNFYTAMQVSGVLKVPFDQAYINRRAIGYGNLTLRGLDLYVVDGVAATVVKYTLSKKVAAFKIKVPFKIKTLPYLPFKFYAKTYADAGYSYLPKQYDTRLNNRFLYTGGFGVDIVTVYDIVLKVEYSFNQLRENGLFLQSRGGF